ncbi:MAG TPA: transketolase [Candidatus Limnocylindrales bacterium]|jgi:transketolase|nr:transketolase [Candidatus Limnocylindrales bacterium]
MNEHTGATDPQAWRELARQLRIDSVRVSSAAGSGHPTSSLSSAELMAVLLAKHMRYRPQAPDDPRNDHLIFSKGHASPLYYAILRALGAVDEAELMTYRQQGSRLEGHPTPVLPWVDVATGSLGQGLPIGVGVALAGKRLDRLPYRTWVLCGDSEMAEGSMWEAFAQASFDRLDNLVAIIDVNRLGQTGPTRYEWDLAVYSDRARAFGWHSIEIDGHDVEQVDRAYEEALATTGRPTVIVARTVKGEGVSAVANTLGAHGKAVEDEAAALAELGERPNITVTPAEPESEGSPHRFPDGGGLELPRYEKGKSVATRKAFGEALAALGAARPDVVALDGEVGNSTYTELFEKQHPERFFQMYIAEQQMIAAAVGLQVRGWRPFAATFAAFLSRAYDFVRMAAVSRATLALSGSHAGVSIGEDGPSQMGLEDLAMMRAVHGSTVLYPCDANQTARLTVAMADLPGISYLRTTRANTPVIYDPDEDFEIGGSRVLRSTDEDRLAIVGAGITVPEALEAADRLAQYGLHARVIDLYSVKPIDTETLVRAAAECPAGLIVVEDHWPEGGLAEAVAGALAGGDDRPRIESLAVRIMPGSATPEQELAEAGIDADAIVAAAQRLAGELHEAIP